MSMYKITLLYDEEGWAYHKRCLALAKYAPPDFKVTLARGNTEDIPTYCDLALQLCYSHIGTYRIKCKAAGFSPKIVAGLNIGYNAKWFRVARREADYVVVNSQLCFDAIPNKKNTTWISNGVDLEKYRPSTSNREVDVISTGSLFHRETKGYDDFLIPIAKHLFNKGIKCDFRLVNSHGGPSKRNEEEMIAWYNTGKVYLVTSITEGTPNPALEAAACGCLVVATKVGNMPELISDGVNGFLVDREISKICVALEYSLAKENWLNMSLKIQETMKNYWGWDKKATQYYNLFRSLLNGS